MAHSDLVQSLLRAFDILDQVSLSAEGLHLQELSSRLGLKVTTAHNLVRTMRARGYLEKGSGGRYHLGPAPEGLARQHRRRSVFRRAESAMGQLQAELGSVTLTFSELVGREICCRLRMAAETPGVVQRPQSQTFSAFGSASGLCMQAFNPEYRDAMAAMHGFEESGQRYWETRVEFERALKETVARGLAVVCVGDVWRLAVPVGERYALGLSYAGTAKSVEAFFGGVVETARTIAG